ncbi:hypothetical protein OHC33_007492 [Knufia fluminis]|uniref:WHIM1 domain-containing protein n=1 Tax=Knufia fluminis TaxID=191047 RepID=A0AAN8EPW0_9EURO|nr:hypothetical protein OHC33_007492 [Knufia fluminis]
MDDSDSDLSSLSSGLSEPDAEMAAKLQADVLEESKPPPRKKSKKNVTDYFKPTPKSERPPTPEPPKRAPSPPHEYVLADKDAIAFIVMFRSRFAECFAASLPHYGPQDIERGVSSEQPSDDVERLLCALLSLCLNRKKPVERGHYGRALEDAISDFKGRLQWPQEWEGKNPLSGGKDFNNMTADERLVLLKTLILWSLYHSDVVKDAIKQAYKQTRKEDDRNQPKAVQPWFSDTWRRKYYLIEGQEDTHFRIYRENEGRTRKTNQWFSVAGTIDEAKSLAEKFETEMPGNQGKLLAEKVRMAIPRWEAGEEKRRRKDYRAQQKARFARPIEGFGIYEGRTRGKRTRYNYDEGDLEDDSDRHASGRSTPFDDGRPVVTSSGRQVKSRLGGMYGETMLTDQRRERDLADTTGAEDTDDVQLGANGRPMRKSIPTKRAADGASRGRYAEGLESGSESGGDAEPSGEEWSGNEDEPDEESEAEAEESQESEDELMDEADGDNTQESLVVQLRYRKGPLTNGTNGHLANNTNSAIGDAMASNGVNGTGAPKLSPLSQVENVGDATRLSGTPISDERPFGTNSINIGKKDGTSVQLTDPSTESREEIRLQAGSELLAKPAEM